MKGKLIIGDRGYQSVDYCREVDAAGGYVLIRYQTQINPVVVHCVLDGRVTSAHRGCRLQEVMRKHRGKTIDVDVQWKGIGDLQRPGS